MTAIGDTTEPLIVQYPEIQVQPLPELFRAEIPQDPQTTTPTSLRAEGRDCLIIRSLEKQLQLTKAPLEVDIYSKDYLNPAGRADENGGLIVQPREAQKLASTEPPNFQVVSGVSVRIQENDGANSLSQDDTSKRVAGLPIQKGLQLGTPTLPLLSTNQGRGFLSNSEANPQTLPLSFGASHTSASGRHYGRPLSLPQLVSPYQGLQQTQGAPVAEFESPAFNGFSRAPGRWPEQLRGDPRQPSFPSNSLWSDAPRRQPTMSSPASPPP